LGKVVARLTLRSEAKSRMQNEFHKVKVVVGNAAEVKEGRVEEA